MGIGFVHDQIVEKYALNDELLRRYFFNIKMMNTIYKNRHYNITKKQEIVFHLFIVHHALKDWLFQIFY